MLSVSDLANLSQLTQTNLDLIKTSQAPLVMIVTVHLTKASQLPVVLKEHQQWLVFQPNLAIDYYLLVTGYRLIADQPAISVNQHRLWLR